VGASENPVDAQKRQNSQLEVIKNELLLKVQSTVVVAEHGCRERKERDRGDDEDGLENTPQLILRQSGVDFGGHSGTMIISELRCLMCCRQTA
jgi:hypothetical protein